MVAIYGACRTIHEILKIKRPWFGNLVENRLDSIHALSFSLSTTFPGIQSLDLFFFENSRYFIVILALEHPQYTFRSLYGVSLKISFPISRFEIGAKPKFVKSYPSSPLIG